MDRPPGFGPGNRGSNPLGPANNKQKMKIAVMSDTHEQEGLVRKALSMIKEQGINKIYHCGDIISPLLLDSFRGFDVSFVYGNNDGERRGLASKARELGFKIADGLVVKHAGKSILVLHGHNRVSLMKAIHLQRFDFIFTGHTHRAHIERIGKTLLVNPGALFHAKPSFAIVDLARENAELVWLNEQHAGEDAHGAVG